MTESIVRRERDPIALRMVRGGFGLMSRIAPRWTAGPASSLFLKPPRKPLRSEDAEALASGERRDLLVEGRRLATWSWGAGPTVLLVHGWGGRGSQLSGFVPPLRDAGYRCVLYDAPAHGSSPGDRTNVYELGAVVGKMAAALGGLHAVVAHSFGSVATALALHEGMRLERAVFLAPPEDMDYFTREFGRRLGLTPRSVAALRARLERRLRRPWDALRAHVIAADFSTPLLVVHDRDDREVPSSHGDTWVAAWRGARLLATSGLGHKGILWSPALIREAVAFVSSPGGDDRGG